MSKSEILNLNTNKQNSNDLNKTKESFPDDKNNQNEFYKIYDKKKIKKEKKIKRVKFLQPIFINIIEVESYKKFNEENTSKDPYEYSNESNNRNDNKDYVMCSCFVF